MTQSSEQAEVGASATDAGVGSPESPPPDRPYQSILQTLQSRAVRAQDPAATTSEHKSAEPGEWDLAADALLATLLREFTSHVASRTRDVAVEIRALQGAVNRAGAAVAACQTEFLTRGERMCMERVVVDDESGSESEDGEGEDEGSDDKADESVNPTNDHEEHHEEASGSDDSSAAIARLEAEERSAIADGMKGLRLFYDPRRPAPPSGNGEDGNGGGGGRGEANHGRDAEEDIIGDNCYYYPSAEGDGFNQRPLPFIVGSREFMESSSCAEVGGEADGDN